MNNSSFHKTEELLEEKVEQMLGFELLLIGGVLLCLCAFVSPNFKILVGLVKFTVICVFPRKYLISLGSICLSTYGNTVWEWLHRPHLKKQNPKKQPCRCSFLDVLGQ